LETSVLATSQPGCVLCAKGILGIVMNTFEFIARNFGKVVLPNGLTNDPVRDSANALTMNHRLTTGNTSRLTGWLVVYNGGSICQAKLAAKGVESGDERTRFQAFAEELDNRQGPLCLLTFTKATINLSNVYLTFDPRVTRVCSPEGVETFDWTTVPGEDSGVAFRNMHKARLKRKQETEGA